MSPNQTGCVPNHDPLCHTSSTLAQNTSSVHTHHPEGRGTHASPATAPPCYCRPAASSCLGSLPAPSRLLIHRTVHCSLLPQTRVIVHSGEILCLADVSLPQWIPTICPPLRKPSVCSHPPNSAISRNYDSAQMSILDPVSLCVSRWPCITYPSSSGLKRCF